MVLIRWITSAWPGGGGSCYRDQCHRGHNCKGQCCIDSEVGAKSTVEARGWGEIAAREIAACLQQRLEGGGEVHRL